MLLLSTAEIVARLARLGIGPDDRYKPPQEMVYVDGEPHLQHWGSPCSCRDLLRQVWHMVNAIGNWSQCYMWKSIPHWNFGVAEDSIPNDIVLNRVIHSNTGVPLGHSGGVVWARSEIKELTSVVFASAAFGVAVADDITLVPDDGQAILRVSHHDECVLAWRDKRRMDEFVANLAKAGFPALEGPETT